MEPGAFAQGQPTPAGLGRMVPAGPGKKIPAGPGIGQWRTYEVTDGLAGAEVGPLLQDREGYLWVGTDAGLSRYDGQGWTTVTAREALLRRWSGEGVRLCGGSLFVRALMESYGLG